ncbi:chromophore lyase CpcT/CpeT [Solitalea sp. MAHUQ-68]|uniref:Chromophore lyase CpcT/CpeT n=1 Tax=Solitalea agri TaxID=2953739 RepID=A0A9X2F829_9SPHI|nr:chromophore lyase CpcT/CpeT [Solitalea agri]MCO4294076.1 chromophore lyase CpcT/CpeT [Solitalea agri]
MFKRIFIITLLIQIILIRPIVSAQKLSKELKQLRENLSGRFSNEDQARFSIDTKPETFVMKQIWAEKENDELWFYAERFRADSTNLPHQQFVWHVKQTDQNRYFIEIFTPKTSLPLITDWKSKTPLFAGLTDTMLVKLSCPLYIVRKTMIEFTGGTKANTCVAGLPANAVYKTIELYCSESTLMLWERGYNATGKLVYGSDKGGTVFRKLEQFK